MAVRVLPNTQDGFGVGGLGIQDTERIVVNQQSIIDAAATGIGLHADAAGEAIGPTITDSIPIKFNGVALNRLVNAEREMDADVLIGVSRCDRGIQVGGDADTIVGNRGVVEGVGATSAIEHTNAEIEIINL